jgi:CTP synthase
VNSIYDVPLAYHARGSTARCCRPSAADEPRARPRRWHDISDRIANPEGEVTIAIVGKYTGLLDAYKSLKEALIHGGIANKVKVNLEWIESEIFEREDPRQLEQRHGILVPGGFGERGAEGKIARRASRAPATCRISASASACRWRCIEAARNLAGIAQAGSTEFGPTGRAGGRPDDRVDARQRAENARAAAISAAPCGSAPTRRCWSRAATCAEIYQTTTISERHRHRYEVNMRYRERLEAAG